MASLLGRSIHEKQKPILNPSYQCVCIVCDISLCAPNSSQSNQETSSFPALKKDLVSTLGEKVVEVTGASYQTSENVLTGALCRVKNLSARNITGLGLIWTITFTNGEVLQTQKLIDYSLHKDVVDMHGGGPFSPYAEKEISYTERDPDIAGSSVRSVEVVVTFAAFENSDGAVIENSQMYQRLLSRREGADIYRKWLDGIYGDNHKNINRVVEKLSSDELPANEKLRKDGGEAGAAAYRQWLLDVYKEKGAEPLKQLLKRK